MNVFEKYLDNIAENAKLTEVINQLCYLNLVKSKDTFETIFGKEFIKFNRWKIDIDDPNKIIMYFNVKYINTGIEYEDSKKFPWNNLLIKIDGYD